jgi:hypothetical protein
MGQRELLFAVLALLLFGSLSSTINSYVIMTSDDILQDEIKYEAISLGQRIIEEVKAKNFDANTTNPPFPNNFESPTSMTHGSGESYPNFNDIDDYCNGYVSGNYEPFEIRLSTDRAVYLIETTVNYVDDNNIDGTTMTRSVYKKINVTIKSESLSQDISLSHVYGFLKPY